MPIPKRSTATSDIGSAVVDSLKTLDLDRPMAAVRALTFLFAH